MAYMTQGGRTPQDLANELNSALITIAERTRRLPNTEDGKLYANDLAALQASLDVCIESPGVLVSEPEKLEAAEAALILVRTELKATIEKFLALDVLRAKELAPRLQIVGVDTTGSSPVANGGA